MSSSLPEYTLEQVASHSKPEDLWLVIEDKVYDVSAFREEHPGGPEVLMDNAGKDATLAFEDVGHSKEAIEMRDSTYLIGTVKRLATTTVQPPVPADTSVTSARTPAQAGCCGNLRCTWVLGGAVLAGIVAIGIGWYLFKRAK